MMAPGAEGEGNAFSTREEAMLAYEAGAVDLQAQISIRNDAQENGWLKTTVGRLIFNEVLHPELDYRNELMDKDALKQLVADYYRTLGNEETAAVLDAIRQLGFHYATRAGITIAINDIEVSASERGAPGDGEWPNQGAGGAVPAWADHRGGAVQSCRGHLDPDQ